VTDFHFMSQNKVKFDLFRRYGVIAAAGDRHLAEFVPEYLKDPETVQEWGYALTPIEYRIENKKDLNEKSMAYASGKSPIPIEPSGEEGVVQIKALLGLGEIVTNVNLPNKGQLEASHEIVVETNALFSKDSVRPVMAGALPDRVALLMGRHMQNQEMILKAALERDTQLAFSAFLNDPTVAGLRLKEAKELFTRMFENTQKYLPDYPAPRL